MSQDTLPSTVSKGETNEVIQGTSKYTKLVTVRSCLVSSSTSLFWGIDKEIAKQTQAGWGAWKIITGGMCDRMVSGTVKGQIYRTT